jgi:uncharacterized membrane protein
VNRTPVIKAIYPHAKQLVDFFFADEANKPLKFDAVIAIEYPRRDMWSIGFITGAGFKSLQEHTGKRLLTIYMPSSPAPMTGYTIIAPVEDVIRLDITVEEAMKWVITGGVLGPLAQEVRPVSGPQLALTRQLSEQLLERRHALDKKLTARLDKVTDQPADSGPATPAPDETRPPGP